MPDQYWRTDGSLNAGGPGLRILEAQDIDLADDRGRPIGVIAAPQNFQQYTGTCLSLLYRTAASRTVIDYLIQHNACTIGFSQGNSAGVGNAQASMSLVAYEIAHQGTPGAQSRAALDAVNVRGVPGGVRWLRDKINTQPRWLIDQVPGTDGGWWAMAQSLRDYGNRWLMWSSDTGEGYFDNERLVGNWGVSSAGLALTETETRDWIRSAIVPVRLSAADRNQLKVATIVALEATSTAGGGSPSAVRFAVGAHDAYRNQRPPAIALGHELIHAYFSHQGRQPGEEIGHLSTVLFEFKCVGLGPWNEHPVSENALRTQWAGVIAHAAGENRVTPGKRIRY